VTEGGKTYTAKVIGVDPKTDLALIKVTDGQSFPYVELGSATPRVGDWVIAVGNPFGLGGTVTAGIVSARGRDVAGSNYGDFLQIDAAVNMGNSGGPTFNLKGEVIGVNTEIFSPNGGSVGIAFDIPAKTVQAITSSLIKTGTVTRGFLDVKIQDVTPDIADSVGLKSAKGALITDATDGGPGAKAGLKSGDIVTKVDGQTIFNNTALMLQAALDGLGFAYVPFDLMKPHFDAGRLVPVLEDWWPRFPGYHLYYANRRQIAPALALVIDALRYRERSQR